MRAVITVIGKDMVGILANVSAVCAKAGMNVVEVTQSILQDMFAMIMMVEITDSAIPFADFSSSLKNWGKRTIFRSTSCMRTFLIPCTGSKT